MSKFISSVKIIIYYLLDRREPYIISNECYIRKLLRNYQNKTNNINVGYWDNGTSQAMNGTNGDTLAFTPDATNGVFSIV